MTLAVLGGGEGGWLAPVAQLCRRPVRLLDLRAPVDGSGELLVDGERVLWQGFDLLGAEAILLERPLYAWPQPGVVSGASHADPRAEREARALALSALHAAAEVVPVLDSPRAADLAVAPVQALDRCAAAGLAVHPWELVPARPAEDGGRVWLDPVGADLVTRPSAPAPGEPAFAPLAFEGGVLSLLAVDGRVLGARRWPGAKDWATDGTHEPRAAATLREEQRALAVEALRALGLTWAQVDLLDDAQGATILSLRAGVDLEGWNRDLDGALVAALAAALERTADGAR